MLTGRENKYYPERRQKKHARLRQFYMSHIGLQTLGALCFASSLLGSCAGKGVQIVRTLLADYPVIIERDVAWGELDAFQHVNNTVYFRYFETARIAYFEALAVASFLDLSGVGPILAETSCRFKAPLNYPDRIAVGAKVSAASADRFEMSYAVASQTLGRIAAEGKGLVVAFDYVHGKKAELPDAVRARLEALEGRSLF